MTIPTTLNKEAKSEFGKGLVICLVKFAEHAERWMKDKKLYKELAEKHPNLFDESEAVEIFFNGASDHLYEIKVPQKLRHTKIEAKVKKLQNLGLEMGHGFNKNKKWSEKDVIEAYDLCREIALMIDRYIGLKPDIGTW